MGEDVCVFIIISRDNKRLTTYSIPGLDGGCPCHSLSLVQRFYVGRLFIHHVMQCLIHSTSEDHRSIVRRQGLQEDPLLETSIESSVAHE